MLVGPRGNTVTFTYEKMDAVRLGGEGEAGRGATHSGFHISTSFTVILLHGELGQDVKNKNKRPFNSCGCRDWGADTGQEGHHCWGGSFRFPSRFRFVPSPTESTILSPACLKADL